MSPQLCALIADTVAVLHGILIVYCISGLIFENILKRKMPNWYYKTAIFVIPIALFFYIFIRNCPINFIENYFRKLAGQDIYQISFISHYLEVLLNIHLSTGVIHLIETITGIFIGIMFIWILHKKLPKKKAS